MDTTDPSREDCPERTPDEHRLVVRRAHAVVEAHAVIAAIAPNYSIDYSEWTGKFYVSAKCEISNGVFLMGITEHQPTPESAIVAFADRLRAVVAPEMVVVGSYTPDRKQYRWENGRWMWIPRVEVTS